MTFWTQEREVAAPGAEGRAERDAGNGRGERPLGVVRELAAHPQFSYAPTLARGAGRPLRLLIADDYQDAAESLAMLLSNVGLETAVTFDGDQALARALRWRPDVCVLDIEMPKLDGREVARRIRVQNWTHRPLLIALTGWTTPQDAALAFDAGFDHYLIKPVEPMKLVRLIQGYQLARSI